MRYQKLTLAALVSAAIAQETTPTLVQALNVTADLSTLNQTIGLLPPDVVATLASATNVTVLAPNNAAFAAITAPNDTAALTALISYHVLTGAYSNFTDTPAFITTLLTPANGNTSLPDGQVVEVPGGDGNVTFLSGYGKTATAVAGPITFTGGVIYIIDSVLEIPAPVSSTATELGLSSLVGALVTANSSAPLIQAIEAEDQVTIFAPNNDAFQNIGSLFDNATAATLAGVLQYHVISGSVLYSTDLTNTSVATLANNTELTVRLFEVNGTTEVYVNNARVVTPNILIENGVVHVIDQVLNPGNATAAADPSTGSGTPAFGGAGESENDPFTTVGPSPSRTDVATSPTSSNPNPTTSNPAWTVAPTGLGIALLAGVALVL